MQIGPEARAMDINEPFAPLAELELREVEELDAAYFEAELQELLPLVRGAAPNAVAGAPWCA